MFRGREMAHPELGRKILERVAEMVTEYAMVESAPRQDGRNMTMVLNPIAQAGQQGARRPEAQATGRSPRPHTDAALSRPRTPPKPRPPTADGAAATRHRSTAERRPCPR